MVRFVFREGLPPTPEALSAAASSVILYQIIYDIVFDIRYFIWNKCRRVKQQSESESGVCGRARRQGEHSPEQCGRWRL
ncbi:hypothetical protein EMEDMD4_790296 [Sinorhizobium medicae]|uniref:Uncharacterized protein n=1 Tax=Sinorhizobium medicae TaxID=110321 RepID=A0A508X678_9HYPH|nr:hypothetical protein EMEDMD4_790296 [Sinorhizobium medicae]